MRKTFLVLALTFVPTLPTAASADLVEGTGNYWLQKCEAPSGSLDSAVCLGFVMGLHRGFVYGSMVTWLTAGNITKSKNLSYDKLAQFYCLPAGVTNGQTQAIFVKYLTQNPERRHEPGESLFVEALARAYPCR